MLVRHLSILLLCQVAWTHAESDAVQFSRDIRPILSQKCFQCHGPDEQHRKAGLRLDKADGEDGAYRTRKGTTAIQPGKLSESELWRRITTSDPDELMPPPEAKIAPLNPSELEQMKTWIESGAPYEAYWAFVPPETGELPTINAPSWSDNPVDRYVHQALDQAELEPSPPASKRAMIRRLSFDLTGLPPTREEIANFLRDDSDRAYENLVDRLLAKPHFGEHMAKYWLDLVRFADTNGLHHDHYREMTPYRDWIIRAFNDNLPFDQFASYQLAGDLFPDPSQDQLIASGFNRLHLIIDRGTALPEESFTRNVVDRVTAVGTAFLGLTVQCAVCHDHKYDPITQRDFYQLFAFFNNFDGGPETGGRSGTDFRRGLQIPYIEFPTDAQAKERDRLTHAISLLEAEIKTLKKSTKENEEPPQKERLDSLDAELKQQRRLRDRVVETIPATLVMKEREEIRPAHILIRGVYDQKGDEVERNTPSFLPPLHVDGETPDRLDLARWLTSEENPLTARVTVNRFWQQLFGVGLVKTSEDFGVQGEVPSHPELLDYLAIHFIRTGWDVKRLLRLIVLSQTYQQQSQADPEAYVNDPDNRMLARGPRFRLDSEMIRDQILAVSGRLSQSLYGRSVKPPQPPDLWKMVAMPNSYPKLFQADEGEKVYRRSIYTFWKRSLPPPQMTIFDAPTREACVARRERTNTPLQALLLMNEKQYFEAAAHAANRILDLNLSHIDDRIKAAYEMVTSQIPSPEELQLLKGALEEFRFEYLNSKDDSAAITAALESARSVDDQVDLAAWTLLVHSLLNLDITKTRQ